MEVNRCRECDSMVDHLGQRTTDAISAIIRKWLERSKDCPLEFEIFLDPEDHFMIRLLKEDLESVISVFLQQSRRWKGIVLDLPHLPPIDCVLFKDIQAPQLTSLTISNTPSYGDDSSWNPPHYLSPIIATAFSIERVTWKLLEIDSSTLVNNLIGTHITDLHLEGRLSIQHCISLLLRSPLLRNCHLDGVTIGPFSVDINSVTPFTLPHLQSLFIIGDQDLLSILAHITAPLLGSLSIGAHTYRDSPVPSELFKFLARSSPPLQHLTLDGRQIQRERIIQCLHLSPHLQTLEIFQKKVHPNYMALTDELMTALGTGCSENGVFICPELTKIRFMGNVVTSDGVFSQMVGERRGGRALANGVASLVYVQVEFGANSTGHSADVERLVNMRPEGLVARVYVGSGDTESD